MNREIEHIVVLPEDDANRQIARGFQKHPKVRERKIHLAPVAGGWTQAVIQAESVHAGELRRYPERLLVLLLDFDKDSGRHSAILEKLPRDLYDRIFVLGVWSEPERLKKSLGMTFEAIGEALAEGCPDEQTDVWNHQLLAHNKGELARLRERVRPFLFD